MKGLHSNGDILQEAAGGDGVDRLSELSDDVLLNILDRVCPLDAIRTCLLSKRTLHLPAMLSRIAVDVYSLLPAAVEGGDFSMSRTMVAWRNGSVARATRRILDARARLPNMPIRKLKLEFFLRLDDCLSIGTSVARAMATNRVDPAEFKIVTEDFDKCAEAYLVGYAKRFSAFIHACPEAFAGLTRLRLENLRFRDPGAIPGILATCERLESLRLFECDSGVKSMLQVEHGRLLELEISSGKFGTVELLWLPNY